LFDEIVEGRLVPIVGVGIRVRVVCHFKRWLLDLTTMFDDRRQFEEICYSRDHSLTLGDLSG
jgi:DNA-directed RNA polymerase subunit E'/Rpb7